jgi:metallo-beta-lactamase family protein
MRIGFHGAAREVTGSCHLVENGAARILLDCGMIQGGKERHERNREELPFHPQELSCVVLSHAHIDHSGRLPLLCKAGYGGPIYATEATVDLCEVLLVDAGRIQEEDARWKIKRLRKQGKDYDWVRPLYTEEEARAILDRFVPLAFGEWREVAEGARVRFTRAGHILGAAIVEVRLSAGGAERSIVFSGDLGVDGARLVGGPGRVECPDWLLIESTYGDRERDPTLDKTEELYRVIDETARRGGKVLIPAFAVGRTQAVLARLNDLVESGRLKGIPVFVDSPMAVEATRVFARHTGAYSEEARRLLRAGDQPLEFDGLRLVRSVEGSKAINDVEGPAVILSASGMCTAGRIKHHLARNVSDPRNTVLFVGYQARDTLGCVIQQGTDPVRIFGDSYRVQARVETIEGFSAHADRAGLLAWFRSLEGTPRKTFVVHGEEEAALALAGTLAERFRAHVEVPRRNQRFDL